MFPICPCHWCAALQQTKSFGASQCSVELEGSQTYVRGESQFLCYVLSGIKQQIKRKLSARLCTCTLMHTCRRTDRKTTHEHLNRTLMRKELSDRRCSFTSVQERDAALEAVNPTLHLCICQAIHSQLSLLVLFGTLAMKPSQLLTCELTCLMS